MPDDADKRGEDAPRRASQRVVRKVTKKRLYNVALHYLSRHSATKSSLRNVLMRRVNASARAHETDSQEGERWIEELLIELQAFGYLNDRVYAENRA